MRGEASLAGIANTYNSLMARLAALQEGMGPAPPAAGGDEELAATYRRRIFKTYFGCGLVTSLIVGCAALLPLLYAHPGTARNYTARQTPLTDATFGIATGSTTPSLGSDRIELAIPHSERKNAPFPLQLTGPAPADSVRLVLRNVPEPIWLSKGERQDEHTWVLQPGDLQDLRLSLRDGTPEAFDVNIELIPGTGKISRSLARIRLVEAPLPQPGQQAAAITKDKAPARIEPAVAQKVAAPAPKDTRPQRPVDLTAQQKAAQKLLAIPAGKSPLPAPASLPAVSPTVEEATIGTVQIKRPEGMSTLGAINHPDQEGRQLWWKMPLPSWAPFPDLPGQK